MRILSEDQRAFYENARVMTLRQIDDVRVEIERELAAVRERITKLNAHIRPLKQMYEAACQILGVPSELGAEAKLPAPTEEAAEMEPSSDDFNLEDDIIDVDEDEELEY